MRKEIGTCKECKWWVTLFKRNEWGECENKENEDLFVQHSALYQVPRDYGCIHWEEKEVE